VRAKRALNAGTQEEVERFRKRVDEVPQHEVGRFLARIREAACAAIGRLPAAAAPLEQDKLELLLNCFAENDLRVSRAAGTALGLLGRQEGNALVQRALFGWASLVPSKRSNLLPWK